LNACNTEPSQTGYCVKEGEQKAIKQRQLIVRSEDGGYALAERFDSGRVSYLAYDT
jgi:hypothetical protein